LPEQALYLKWRPLAFDDMVGQEHITRTLRNALRTDRIRHAYLFSGPRGTGKTTTARLLAKAINCQNPDPDRRPCNQCDACRAVNEGRYLDLIEIDAATHTSVDDVRELRERIAFAPGEGRFKVYIIDEVHRFSGSAFDALLKTLEEPPEHAIFVLATTELDKVPATIKSRCLLFQFRRFSVREVADRLEQIASTEGLVTERTALEMIARQGTGSMRDSVSLLDQIVTDPSRPVTVALVQDVLGTASSAAVRALVQAMANEDVAEALRIINQAIDTGSDPRQLGQQIVEYLRSVLLAQTAGPELLETSEDERETFVELGERMSRGTLIRALRTFNEAVNTYRGGWQPQLALELALVESLRAPLREEPAESAPSAAAARPRTAPETRQPGPPPIPSPAPEAADVPGAEPVIPASRIAERWDDVLRAMYRQSQTAPEVMRYFRVSKVEGSTLTLVTDQDLYYQRIEPFPEKKNVIARALFDVFSIRFNIRVKLASAVEADDASRQLPQDDPLLAAAADLGAKVRKVKK
jgi:DNA polymerase-3 subunit gamma/tau